MSKEQAYYVPHGTYWPIIGSIGIATFVVKAIASHPALKPFHNSGVYILLSAPPNQGTERLAGI
jgi:hypothetical protein